MFYSGLVCSVFVAWLLGCLVVWLVFCFDSFGGWVGSLVSWLLCWLIGWSVGWVGLGWVSLG